MMASNEPTLDWMPEKRLLGVGEMGEVGEVGRGDVTLEDITGGEVALEVELEPVLKGALVGVSLPSLTWRALAMGVADMVEVIGIESDLWRRS